MQIMQIKMRLKCNFDNHKGNTNRVIFFYILAINNMIIHPLSSLTEWGLIPFSVK